MKCVVFLLFLSLALGAQFSVFYKEGADCVGGDTVDDCELYAEGQQTVNVVDGLARWDFRTTVNKGLNETDRHVIGVMGALYNLNGEQSGAGQHVSPPPQEGLAFSGVTGEEVRVNIDPVTATSFTFYRFQIIGAIDSGVGALRPVLALMALLSVALL